MLRVHYLTIHTSNLKAPINHFPEFGIRTSRAVCGVDCTPSGGGSAGNVFAVACRAAPFLPITGSQICDLDTI